VDGKLEARGYFSSLSSDDEMKVREGHITDISAGYRVLESVWIPKGQTQTIDGRQFAGPVKVATKSRIKEGSLTPIGADTKAKIRSQAQRLTADDMEQEIRRVREEVEKLAAASQQSRGGVQMEATATITEPKVPTPEELARLESVRTDEINALAKRYKDRVPKLDENARDAIELKIPAERFRGDIYARITDGKPLDVPPSQLDLSPKDQRRYSISKLIASSIPRDLGGDPKRFDATFERECSEEIAKRMGIRPQGNFIPYDIQKRDLTVGSATAGGDLVGTQLLSGSFIEMLYGKMLARQLGVQYLPGLVGNIDIPGQSGASTFYWVAEQSAITQADQTYTKVSLSPKTGGARTVFSRRLLLQSSPGIEGLVNADLAMTAALGVDKAVFEGTGTTQPQGVVGGTSVASVTGTSFVIATAIAYETAVAGSNADIGSMAFVTTPAIRGTLKGRLVTPTYGSAMIWGPDNMMNGYPAYVSTQITTGHILFGVWSQAIVGEWGALDVIVDPYSLSTQGDVKVTVFISVDVGLRHGEAFATSTSFS
jgi:HK97 family phage major capsid protein